MKNVAPHSLEKCSSNYARGKSAFYYGHQFSTEVLNPMHGKTPSFPLPLWNSYENCNVTELEKKAAKKQTDQPIHFGTEVATLY